VVRGGRHRDGDRRRCDRDPGNLLRHASRDPPPHRPGLLRRLGRLPDETYDHSRGRTHEPAATNPVGDPEKNWLLISAAEESQGAGRIRRRTRGYVRRIGRPDHSRDPGGLLIHILERNGSILPRPPAEREHRVWDRPREPRGFHRLDALRAEGKPAGRPPSVERRRAARVRPLEPARLRHRAHRVTHNGQIRPPPWLGSHGPMARTLQAEAHRRAVLSPTEQASAGDRPRVAGGGPRIPGVSGATHRGAETPGAAVYDRALRAGLTPAPPARRR